MSNYKTLKNTKVATLLFFMLAMSINFSFAQGLASSGLEIQVNPTQNEEGESVCNSNQSNGCSFGVELEFVYSGGNFISVNPPSGIDFASEQIEQGLLIAVRGLKTGLMDLTRYNDLILNANQPMTINLTKFNLQEGIIYRIILINNQSQVVRFNFIYQE